MRIAARHGVLPRFWLLKGESPSQFGQFPPTLLEISYSSSTSPWAAEKLSISMPHKLASTARKRAGRRGLSSSVAQAVARELERQALGQFLDELDQTLGPVPDTNASNS